MNSEKNKKPVLSNPRIKKVEMWALVADSGSYRYEVPALKLDIIKGNIIEFIEFVNLTPHDVVIQTKTGETLTVPKSGVVARIDVTENIKEVIGGAIPVVTQETGSLDPDPLAVEGRYYLVSSMVKSHVYRSDFLAPNTSPTELGAVRNEKGHIVAVKSLVA